MPKIYVDADACPKPIKEILFRFAERCQIKTILVANQAIPKPPSQWISGMWVDKGFDVADNAIVKMVEAKDLVITSDIPLASEAIQTGAVVIDPKGSWYDKGNIAAKLTMRNFMTEMRETGVAQCRNKPFNPRQSHEFSKLLDRYHRYIG